MSLVEQPNDIEIEEAAAESREFQSPDRDLPGALHEVSNALTVVLGWLECAEEELPPGDVARRALEIAKSHAKLGRRLARRAIGDDSEPIAQESDLDALVNEVMTGVEREALRRRVVLAIVRDPSTRAKVAKAAPSLFQVLTNLLLNAIAMTPEGSTVTVETLATQADARISVIDQGPGVDPARRATIFTGGKSGRRGGAGVGLRHAYALAASHGGMLALAESSRGARFDVTWPIVGLRPLLDRRSSAPVASLEGIRILLLEDDDAVVGLLSTALSLRGATIQAARTQVEFQAATESQNYDAALLDLSPILGDVGGALRRVQTRCPSAKVVLISGSAAEVPAAAQGLMSAWVRKPFEIGEILAVLRNLPREGR